MSNELATISGAQVPAAFHSLMQQMQGSELQQNVGAKYAVISFKGKVFRIKHDGTETPLMINYNGQMFAAPYMDVVLPLANGALSKTFYQSGYTEGSDESPTCWSEDGRTPLAPIEQRPRLANGTPCTDCQLCPMNVFGSKINAETGSKGKACADTRKLIVLPMKTTGQMPDGTPITEVDADNAKYGGPMLMRVPAASLQVFAEYDRKLQAMGVPYFAVVTRMTFDQTVAYPKFVLTPVRLVTEAEAQAILAVRNGPQVQAILNAAHSSAPAVLGAPAETATASPAPVQQAFSEATGGAILGFPPPVQAPVPPPQAYAAPSAPAPVQAAPAPVQAAPVTPAPMVAPVAPVAPATAAPVAPAPMVAPVAPATAAPVAPAPVQAPPATPPAAFPGFPPAAAPAAPSGDVVPFPGGAVAYPPGAHAAPVPEAAPPAQQPSVSPDLLGRIDQLLGS